MLLKHHLEARDAERPHIGRARCGWGGRTQGERFSAAHCARESVRERESARQRTRAQLTRESKGVTRQLPLVFDLQAPELAIELRNLLAAIPTRGEADTDFRV